MKKYILLVLMAAIMQTGFAQVAINSSGANPATGAGLDVDFTNRGLLIPRVALSSTVSNSPIGAGLTTSIMVYNTATVSDVTPGYYYWNGTNWVRFLVGKEAWMITGNDNTNPTDNFIGTTNDQPLQIRTNNLNRIRIMNSAYSSYPTVGIGTIVPVVNIDGSGGTSLLHVHDGGSGVPSNLILSTHSTAAGVKTGALIFAATQMNNNRRTGSIESYLTASDGTNGSGDLRFFTNNNNAFSEKVRIIPDGNVGINNTTPVNKLDVYSNSSTGATIYGYLNEATSGANWASGRAGVYGRAATSTSQFQAGVLGYQVGTGNNSAGVVGAYSTTVYGGLGYSDNTSNRCAVFANNSSGSGFALLVNAGGTRLVPLASGANGAILRTTAAGDVAITNFSGDVNQVLLGNNTFGTAVTSATAWQLTGNAGTTVATNFIGTTDNVGLVFRTNNTEQMRLQNSGQLTIGATAAGGKLDVHQTASNDVARFTTYGNTNDIRLRRTQGTQAAPTTTSGTGTILGRIFAEGYNGASYTAAAAIEMTIDAAGGTSTDMPGRITFSTTPDGSGTLAEIMRITNGGFVGIGTTSPTYKFQVYGASGSYPARVGNPDGYLNFGPANNAWCHFQTDRPRFYFNTGGTFDTGNIGSYDEDLSLQTSGTTRITALNSNGYVGIATTSPSSLLNIVGAHSTTQMRLTLPAAANGGGTGDVNLQLWVSEPGITWDAGGIGTNVTNNNGAPAGFGRINASLGQSYIRFITNGGAMAFNTTNNAGTYYQTMYLVNGNVGIGTTTPTYKLHVIGRFKSDGINETSDIRLKKNIQPIANALSKVMQLQGVTYEWNKEGMEEGTQLGLIAQEVEKILPEIVDTDNEGYKSIQYSVMVALLIEAMKEQQLQQKMMVEKIGSMENDMAKIKAMLNIETPSAAK